MSLLVYFLVTVSSVTDTPLPIIIRLSLSTHFLVHFRGLFQEDRGQNGTFCCDIQVLGTPYNQDAVRLTLGFLIKWCYLDKKKNSWTLVSQHEKDFTSGVMKERGTSLCVSQSRARRYRNLIGPHHKVRGHLACCFLKHNKHLSKRKILTRSHKKSQVFMKTHHAIGFISVCTCATPGLE